MFAVFCSTSIGRNITILEASDKEDAKNKALFFLTGEDIEKAEITKTEEFDSTLPAVFWDNEIVDET